ncbi:MAG: hypothetical protein LUF85_17630 [Bacteroides sp.]|nr:hypothetical protein [Bacteroides sp.]
MAKDGDIVDVMFQWIIDLFGWFVKIAFKIAGWLFVGLFSLLVAGVSALWRAATQKNKQISNVEEHTDTPDQEA